MTHHPSLITRRLSIITLRSSLLHITLHSLLITFLLLSLALKKCPKCAKEYPDTENYCEMCEDAEGRPVRLRAVPVKPREKPKVQGIVTLSGDTLIVSSTPAGAAIKVDGRYVGNAPDTLVGLGLEVGVHSVQLSAPGHDDFTTELEVRPVVPVAGRVLAAPESLFFFSDPAGAEVLLDGKPAGITPDTMVGLSPGRHVAVMNLAGFLPCTVSVEVPLPVRVFLGRTTAGIEEWLWLKDSSVMVMVPAGEFVMGSAAVDEPRDERPLRRVYLDEYLIDKYEVTNRQFARFAGETGYKTEAEKAGVGWRYLTRVPKWEAQKGISWRSFFTSATRDHPVVLVTWNDAKAYCDWAGKRLPTEAEWEKAARGTNARMFPWGEELPDAAGVARVNWGRGIRREDLLRDGFEHTAPVGTFEHGASPYGCMDMAGNAQEWCHDWYDADYYSTTKTTGRNPPGPDSGSARVLRGGSAYSQTDQLRCADRFFCPPSAAYDIIGFRSATNTDR